jgi:hypothetical protein
MNKREVLYRILVCRPFGFKLPKVVVHGLSFHLKNGEILFEIIGEYSFSGKIDELLTIISKRQI